jgi:XTP/dITP diphosphohydrolase
VKLLAELAAVDPPLRSARYVCVLALALPRPAAAGRRPAVDVVTRRGTTRGRIALAPSGTGGFGYDPLFEPSIEPPGGRTFGRYSAEEKHAISHRARAARRMREVLEARGF